MTIDDKIKVEKHKKYQHHLQVKFINVPILKVRKYYNLIKAEQYSKLSSYFFPLDKAFGKQISFKT